MRDTIQYLVETCTCGHDRCTHYATRFVRDYDEASGNILYREKDERGLCLGQHCDCKKYVYKEPK